MFWVMMYMLLFKGSEVPDLSFAPDRKVIIEAVTDEQRLPAILTICEEMASEEEAMALQMKAHYRELIDLSRDHAASDEKFKEAFERMDRLHTSSQSALIEYRFRLKAQMTRKEWKAVFKNR